MTKKDFLNQNYGHHKGIWEPTTAVLCQPRGREKGSPSQVSESPAWVTHCSLLQWWDGEGVYILPNLNGEQVTMTTSPHLSCSSESPVLSWISLLWSPKSRCRVKFAICFLASKCLGTGLERPFCTLVTHGFGGVPPITGLPKQTPLNRVM